MPGGRIYAVRSSRRVCARPGIPDTQACGPNLLIISHAGSARVPDGTIYTDIFVDNNAPAAAISYVYVRTLLVDLAGSARPGIPGTQACAAAPSF